jgi:hypothetical protein
VFDALLLLLRRTGDLFLQLLHFDGSFDHRSLSVYFSHLFRNSIEEKKLVEEKQGMSTVDGGVRVQSIFTEHIQLRADVERVSGRSE